MLAKVIPSAPTAYSLVTSPVVSTVRSMSFMFFPYMNSAPLSFPFKVSRCTSRFGQSKTKSPPCKSATLRRMESAFFSVEVHVRLVVTVTVPTFHSVPERA